MDRRTFLKGLGGAAALATAATQRRIAALARVADRAREPISLVRVAAGARVVELIDHFDLTEHGHDGWFDVVLHPGDRARLERTGMPYRVVLPDLVEAELAQRSGEARAALDGSPEQRFAYRLLLEFELDMRALAQHNPDLVRLIELPHRTHEGRTVYGLEVAGRVATAGRDGRPTACLLGLHHAREWPSAELPLMFAQDVVDEYRKGNTEIVDLLDGVRLLVVPIVNPDGFSRSRETVSDFVAPLPGAVALAGELAYHRKNMRSNTGLPAEVGQGVDPNRNYPFVWGGPGTSDQFDSQVYHGPGPGSEPEVANVLELFRRNHVLTLVTNHTYSNLVLWPWGHTAAKTPDDEQLSALGRALAGHNAYRPQQSIGLYPTAGTTEDWLYAVCGGFGYTFEIGSAGILGLGNTTPIEGAGFHPQYNLHIANFYALNRGAYLELMRAALDERLHVVIEGTAAPGSVVSVRKTGRIPLDRPDNGTFSRVESIDTSFEVDASGRFVWHVNPSPLPLTVQDVRRGAKPVSALEPYAIEARRPDGTTAQLSLVAERGKRYTIDLT